MTLHAADLRGLNALGAGCQQAERTPVYRGKERLLVDGIRVILREEFLRALA